MARTPERLQLLHKQAALARGFGVEVQVITAREAGERWPLMRTDDLQGALWIPGDGKANPPTSPSRWPAVHASAVRGWWRVCRSPACCWKTARRPARGRRAHAAAGAAGAGALRAAGQLRRPVGAAVWRAGGVNVPLYSAEHFYLVTGQIPGVHPMLPVLRDPDGLIYYKEEVGGLVMGGFELQAKPWAVHPIPADFQFQLLARTGTSSSR